MKLRLKKQGDGNAVVTVVRADGSSTSGRLGSRGFGAVHDLAHYAVETTLRHRSGFYGLIAQGWDIPGFEAKGTAAQLPDEAVLTECIVSALTNLVFGGQETDGAAFNWAVAEAMRSVRPDAAVPAIGAEDLRTMQLLLAGLLARWRALPAGGTLELDVRLG